MDYKMNDTIKESIFEKKKKSHFRNKNYFIYIKKYVSLHQSFLLLIIQKLLWRRLDNIGNKTTKKDRRLI